MTSRLRSRPSTDVMTQVVRPDCEVVGKVELHSYLGPGKIAGLVPCPSMYGPYALWWSQGTAWDSAPETSKKSRTVFAANDPLLQQWSRTKKRQHHLITTAGLSLMPLAGLLAVCNDDSAGARLGPFEASGEGASTAIFGPRHVMASVDGAKTVATLRFSPSAAAGWKNFLVCSDPSPNPGTFARQTPSTVLLGMTAGDTASAVTKCMSRFVLDCALDWALSKIGGAVGSRVTGLAWRFLERRLPGLVAQALRPFIGSLAEQAGNAVTVPLKAGVALLRGEMTADASDEAFADDWDEYMVSP